MQTDIKDAGPFERILTIKLEEADLESAKTKAARKLSKEMKIKGFRPGKAPRSIVERMVGEADPPLRSNRRGTSRIWSVLPSRKPNSSRPPHQG